MQTIPVRQIPDSKSVYLTFDDGPLEGHTDKVLEILKEFETKATFFVVVEKAIRNRKIIESLLNAGHAIGNHSWDHSYGVFFKGTRAMDDWVTRSEEALQRLLDSFGGKRLGKSVGFRPPAGVVTPVLKSVLSEKRIPLLLWNMRFYDAVWLWTMNRAQIAAKSLPQKPGSIVLLHDVQKTRNHQQFLVSLRGFLKTSKELGTQFDPIPTLSVQG